MMKRVFLCLTLLLLAATTQWAATQEVAATTGVTFTIVWGDPHDSGNPLPHSPLIPPTVDISDGVLAINAQGTDYTVTLYTTTGSVAFTDVIPAGHTTLTLPSTLKGTYVLRLQPSGASYYFEAIVSL